MHAGARDLEYWLTGGDPSPSDCLHRHAVTEIRIVSDLCLEDKDVPNHVNQARHLVTRQDERTRRSADLSEWKSLVAEGRRGLGEVRQTGIELLSA